MKKTTSVAVRRKAAVQKVPESVGPQTLLLKVIDKKLPIETMERLLGMWARDQFFTALAGFQSECPVVEKNHKASVKSKKGEDSSFTYGYSPIEDMVEAVKGLFVKYGLSWMVKPKQTREDVTAEVHVHHSNGHVEVTSFTVPIDPSASMTDPQKAGSALTYATRYAFKAAFGIQTKGEDTDAQAEHRQASRRQVFEPVQESPGFNDADLKAMYDEATSIIATMPPEAANKLRDSADRNLDLKNGGALSALLAMLRRRASTKGAMA